MTNAILIIIGFLILVYYTKSELKILIEEKSWPLQEPEPLQPEPQPEPEPEPVHIIPEPVKVEPQPEPQPEPVPPKMGRRQLEQAARNCLTAAGCKFDVYDYTRYKTDIELMDIIKDYNLNN